MTTKVTQASGHNAYVPGYKASHVSHHEWRTAENSAAYLIPTLQSMVQANPRLTLLDVGAGSGTISASLARYMPQGQIAATDLAEEILSQAAEHARKAGVKNVRFQQANIYELPFPDNSFDVVHASMVLCHLDSPVEALKEMIRVTKPGGVVANRESDLRMWSWWPELPGLSKAHKLQLETHRLAGGSIDGGTKMVSWALKAGVTREQITATMGTWCYSTPEERAMWGGVMSERLRGGGMRAKALESKLASEQDLDEMADAWDEWVSAEDGVHASMHGEILIQK